jgi:hypothetical protein
MNFIMRSNYDKSGHQLKGSSPEALGLISLDKNLTAYVKDSNFAFPYPVGYGRYSVVHMCDFHANGNDLILGIYHYNGANGCNYGWSYTSPYRDYSLGTLRWGNYIGNYAFLKITNNGTRVLMRLPATDGAYANFATYILTIPYDLTSATTQDKLLKVYSGEGTNSEGILYLINSPYGDNGTGCTATISDDGTKFFIQSNTYDSGVITSSYNVTNANIASPTFIEDSTIMQYQIGEMKFSHSGKYFYMMSQDWMTMAYVLVRYTLTTNYLLSTAGSSQQISLASGVSNFAINPLGNSIAGIGVYGDGDLFYRLQSLIY